MCDSEETNIRNQMYCLLTPTKILFSTTSKKTKKHIEVMKRSSMSYDNNFRFIQNGCCPGGERLNAAPND